MKRYLVIANGEPPSSSLFAKLWKNHDVLVAVDGGFHTCLNYGFVPQLLIGDFDSIDLQIRNQYSHIEQIYTPDQDKSDLEKTLEYLLEKGAEEITVCGALGRRLDHSLTNICLLSRFPVKVKFETETEICYTLPTHIKLTCTIGQTLSLIPLSTSVDAVVTSGLKWNLKGQNLDKQFVSLSNLAVEESISIQFSRGDLLLCLNQVQSHDKRIL